jgi:hypothetical protein
MPKPNNAMEIFKHLDKSNCRECGEKTCLAFAGAVYQSRKEISRCPKLDSEIVAFYSNDDGGRSMEETGEQFIEDQKETLSRIDLAQAAQRTGGHYDGRKLTLKILGKDFGVDPEGNFHSDIHVNPWIVSPFLDYIINARGVDPTGEWVSYRELKDAKDNTYPFFQKRCEQVIKRIADRYPDLFEDLVHIFGGQKVPEQFESDVAVVLTPLPKVPLMICYWGPDDGLDSTINIYIDRSADENLPNGTTFTLCAGLAAMFEKLTHRHAAFVS